MRGSYGFFHDRLLNLATYLAAVGDGTQIQRVILTGPAAAGVFQSRGQKLAGYPEGAPPSGLVAFANSWALGYTQQGNFLLSSQILRDLTFDAGYVWVKGTQLARSRDYNPADGLWAAAFLEAGHSQAALLASNYFRPLEQVSEVMAFENSASSVYHGLRLTLRGRVSQRLALNASYTLSKAIDDAEEIFPHSRAQDMRHFRAERGLALYDQRHRFVFSMLYETGGGAGSSLTGLLSRGWTIAPIVEAGSGRPVNVLLGFDNNLDQEPGTDRPDRVPAGAPGAVLTRFGSFAVPALGAPGNVGRNAFLGPGFASVSVRLQRSLNLTESVVAQIIAEGFNLFNRTNVRSVNPNYLRAGEPLSAHDPRQIQFGLRLQF